MAGIRGPNPRLPRRKIPRACVADEREEEDRVAEQDGKGGSRVPWVEGLAAGYYFLRVSVCHYGHSFLGRE